MRACSLFRIRPIYTRCELAPAFARGWIKTIVPKWGCIHELRSMDLLTPDQPDEALTREFDIEDRMLIIHTEVDPRLLRQAGFSQKLAAAN